MINLKKQLFELAQLCHDHSDEFVEEFMQTGLDGSDVRGFYFSGSQCLVVYEDNYYNENNFIVRMSAVLDWVEGIRKQGETL